MEVDWIKYLLWAYRRLHRLLATDNPWAEIDPVQGGSDIVSHKDEQTCQTEADEVISNEQQDDTQEWSPMQTVTDLEEEIREAKRLFVGMHSRVRKVRRKKVTTGSATADELPPLEERIVKLSDIMNMNKAKPKTAANYVVCYDISDNRVRTKLAHYLQEKGFQRMQKSVFIGQIERATMKTVKTTLVSLSEIFIPTDSIVVVPLNESDLRKMNIVGKKINLAYALGRSHTLYI